MKTSSPMSKFLPKFLITCSIVALSSFSYSQDKPSKGTWKSVNESSIPIVGMRYLKPSSYLTLKLDLGLMHQQLNAVKRIDDPNYVPVIISLPKPDGTYGMYKVYENETMSAGLAQQFPEIRSFDGMATDNSGEVVKFDLTPQGFHAMTLIPGKATAFIDPYSFGGDDIQHYICYSKDNFTTDKLMQCDIESLLPTEYSKQNEVPVKSYGNCTKRTYRLAISATGEYTAFHGGTLALAQAAQVTTINRVNGVYMRDFAVTMTIIPNNNLIVYTNAGTDPFTNGNPGSMITQNQNNTTTVIGSANYDVGHVFGTNSGGLAGLGVVCSNTNKARGVTGSSAPIGDPFDIDYVAHELGHQFSGNHSFRGNAGSCSGNANGATAMEPGSGSSIMAYAGICAPQNVQANSDDHFHGVNMAEMHTYITTGNGNNCPVATAIPNQNAPVITSQSANVTIPINTPFALTAVATDADGDALTYCWEQMDNQNSTQPPVATSTNGPNFRSRTPQSSGTRYFPSIASQLSGGPFTWEVLPSVSRTMNFRCVVRDNEIGGGCNDDANVIFTTTATAGPFIVNYPTATGITWAGGSTQTVTWSVANTNNAPVSCANVDIMLSTDGGLTFTVIDNDVPNDGSEDVTVPNTASTSALIIVMCENGTFFDVSNNVFTITAATNDYSLNLANSLGSACQGTDVTYTINVGQIGSFSNPVTLSLTGLPVGATANFSPNPATPGTSVTLTISNTASVIPGSYPIVINGSATSGNHSINATLQISNNTSAPSTLNLPANMEPSAPVQPTITWSNAGAGMSYDLEIATDPGFTTIVESASGLTVSSYAATLLSAATTYYWRVNSYNSCSSAGFSAIFQFTTSSCGTFSSTNVPIAISASGTPTVTSTLIIPTGGTINDLNVVSLVGTHSYISDLTFTLTSPSGTSVVLFDQICGNENNFNLSLDDESAPGALPCPPVGGGTYQPENSLSAFDGENMSGTWTLTIEDHANDDGGSLTSWGLEICFTAASPCDAPDIPALTGNNSFCTGGSTTLSIASGNLNDATDWQWTSASCGGTVVGTGTSVIINTPGTYFVRGLGGCVTSGTCQTISITQTSINATVQVNGGALSSNQSGAGYVWLDCNNGNAPINGATSQTFSPTVNGSYAVQITLNGCSATSSCVSYNSAGLEQLDFNVVLYPNPTTGKVTLSFDNEKTIETMTVTDLTGRLINNKQTFTAQMIEIDLSSEAAGVYFLNIEIEGKSKTFRIAKQ